MSSAATDIRYGRRGGRWATSGSGVLLDELDALRARHGPAGTWPTPVDFARLFHPETIAWLRAHDRTCGGRHRSDQACPATPDPVDLAELWAGRARTAAARQAAGVALTALDVEALRKAARR